MNFWEWLNERAERKHKLRRARIDNGATLLQRYRGPTERQGVTIAIFALAVGMLLMARENPQLWETKLFEVIFQAVVLTGLLNMITAFHFAANKSEETRQQTTTKLAEAVKAQAQAASEATEGRTNSLGDPVADDAPTGAPGDPVHVREEK